VEDEVMLMSLIKSLRRLFVAMLLVLVAFVARTPVVAQATRPDAPVSLDPYGYVVYEQDDPECGFDLVDLGPGGDPVIFTASGAAPADDDGGAVITLGDAFELFGEPMTSFVMSSNGYLAAASSLAAEDGGDFSNDSRLPAIPGNAKGVPARLLAYHDDLSGSMTGGSAYSEHFADCPRPSEALGSEACSVFEWTDWSVPAGGDPFRIQAVVYHASYEIVFQARPGATPLRGGTIGIQNADATLAVQYRDTEPELSGDTAVCIFDPRFPSGGPVADLELTKSDKIDQAASGETVVYAVAAINRGPSSVVGARVTDLLPDSLINCSWTCEASPDSGCTPAGTSDIDDLVDISSNGWVDYLLTCEVGASTASVTNTATVVGPAGVRDPDLQNNTASDVDGIANAAPDCAGATASPNELWPPDHMFVSVAVEGVTDPEGDPVTLTIDSIFQDEPVFGPGSGNFGPDCRNSELDDVSLRAEREGPGNGRVYHIGFTADDGRGGICSGEVVVGVPSEIDPYVAPVDDGALYDSCVADPNRRHGRHGPPQRAQRDTPRNP
jgi:uncharacterized repeat protein (TIGR01451 family)